MKKTKVKSAPATATATGRIAVVMWFDENFMKQDGFFRTLYTGLENELRQAGFTPHPVYCEDYFHTDPAHVLTAPLAGADGCIMLDLYPTIAAQVETVLRGLAKPVVVLNYESIADDLDSVVFDSYANTRKMVQFLVGLGHQRLCCLQPLSSIDSRNESLSVFARRAQAFRDVLAAHRLPVDERLITSIKRQDPDQRRIAALLEGPNRPTAIFCAEDEIALALYRLSGFFRLRIPADLTVVGYDGIPSGKLAKPPLTTIETPLERMCRVGVQRLAELIRLRAAGEKSEPLKIVLPGKIFEGGSHGAPAV
jgi:LacI family transcriptional regulator